VQGCSRVAVSNTQDSHQNFSSPSKLPARRLCAQGTVFVQANIELDRAKAAEEAGFRVAMLKLRQPELTTKSDVIVGVPAELCPRKFQWPWQ
jgi:hypothetical protein